jgi:hypothetical protein
MQTALIFFALITVLLFGLVSYVSIGWRIHKYPELRAGYFKLFFVWLIWVNSWTIGVFSRNFFQKQEWLKSFYLDSDPALYGILSFGTICLLGTFWIFLGHGDKTLEKYPGWFMFPVGRAERIRVYWVLIIFLWLIPIFLPTSLKTFFNFQYPSTSPEPSPIYFPFFFVGMWVLVCFFLSIMDGWQWLSEKYSFKNKFEGKKHGGISGMLCGVGFHGILSAGADKNGLYLSVLFPFRIGHPPLFIPWEEITCGKQKILFFKYAVLEFEKAPGVLLMIPEKIVWTLSEESGIAQAFKGLIH